MKVLKLEVQNVKGIKHVTLEPDGNWCVIAGENEQGKSSFCDGIMYLFCGKGKIPVRVLRDGEKNGFAEASIGDAKIAKVTRKFGKGEKTQLIVTSVDGKRLDSPQAICDELMGGASITYDPTAFQQLSKAKQIELLRSLDPALDFTLIDSELKDDYEKRSLMNRDIKHLEGKLETMPAIPADLPDMEISVQDLSLQLKAVHEVNRDYNQQNATLQKHYADYASIKLTVDRLTAELVRAESTLSGIKEAGQAQKKIVDGMSPSDPTPLETQLSTAEETNTGIRAAHDAKETRLEITELKNMVEDLNTHMEELKSQKDDLLADASFPVPGLAFNEDGITVGGLPFDEDHMSSGEMFRISTQMAIALNTTGILICRNGVLLDAKNRAMVKEMAEAAGIFTLFEVVGDDEEAQLVIEDGNQK